jgi:hypothetical protein
MRKFLTVVLTTWMVAASANASPDCGDPRSGALGVVDAYMDAFNSADATAHAATLHYPSLRLDADGELAIYEAAADYEALFSGGRARLPWHHTLYDAKTIVHEGPLKVHVAVHFTRYLEDGAKFSEHDSLYIAVCREGQWGIALRSSFVPVIRPSEAP